jgi:hypothetical protein
MVSGCWDADCAHVIVALYTLTVVDDCGKTICHAATYSDSDAGLSSAYPTRNVHVA